APDGQQVLVVRSESNVRDQLWLVDIATSEARNLTPELGDGPAEHTYPQWSADRCGLYLLSNDERQFSSLAWLDLATTEMTYLRDESWDTEILQLTDDGTRMALVTNEDGYSRLELFDVSKGWESRQTLPTPGADL